MHTLLKQQQLRRNLKDDSIQPHKTWLKRWPTAAAMTFIGSHRYTPRYPTHCRCLCWQEGFSGKVVGLYQVVNVQEVHLTVWTAKGEGVHTSLDHALCSVNGRGEHNARETMIVQYTHLVYMYYTGRHNNDNADRSQITSSLTHT